jgi:hypothetical protein
MIIIGERYWCMQVRMNSYVDAVTGKVPFCVGIIVLTGQSHGDTSTSINQELLVSICGCTGEG